MNRTGQRIRSGLFNYPSKQVQFLMQIDNWLLARHFVFEKEILESSICQFSIVIEGLWRLSSAQN